MKIAVPKEIKNHEYRVGMTPNSVAAVVQAGHQVAIESGAGAAIGFADELYLQAGAQIVANAEAAFDFADMIVKVKEPQASERKLLKAHQTLFTYLHLAPDAAQTEDLIASGATCIAYETVTDAAGHLPLLAPMSEVAGRLSIQAGAHCLEKAQGGRGVLLGGVPGVLPAKVLVIGGGVVGQHAIAMAVGMAADVTVLDTSAKVLRSLDERYGNRIKTLYSTAQALAEEIQNADLVIGAVLIPGASAPKLVSRDMLKTMKTGAVLVDVAIDQGGCFETSKPTTHAEPTYIVDGVVHYCVANMPGAVARTSTQALNNATLPFILALANKGVGKALAEDPHLAQGLNVFQGQITNAPVAKAQGVDLLPLDKALALF